MQKNHARASSNEALARLTLRLRAALPEATIQLVSKKGDQAESYAEADSFIRLSFSDFPAGIIECRTLRLKTFGNAEAGQAGRKWISDDTSEQFQFFESSLVINSPQLENVSDEDFQQILGAENLGLRGLTVTSAGALDGRKKTSRILRLQTGFVGQKGRTVDELDNITLDILTLLRFARLLEDRIQRSSVGGSFGYEMYHSQYIAGNRGRTRFINTARSLFKGSPERVFGQVSALLKNDFHCQISEVQPASPLHAKIRVPQGRFQSLSEIQLKVHEDIPMVTCLTTLALTSSMSSAQVLKLVITLNSQWNMLREAGHFETGGDGLSINFVAWKHLTNDLRLYSIDYMFTAVTRAAEIAAPYLIRTQMVRDAKNRKNKTEDAA